MMNRLKIFNTIDSHEQNLGKKRLRMLKVPDIINFTETQEFNRLTIINFNARTVEALKNFPTKSKVETALYIGDKNKEKIKNFKLLI